MQPCNTHSYRQTQCSNFPHVLNRKTYWRGQSFRLHKWKRTATAYIAKEEATTPTVTLNVIFIQSTIFAHEQRDVATCNILGAFLQVDNLDYVLMHLDGILAELMVKVAPSLYCKYVTTNATGKPVLYAQLEKAVYGMMKSAPLFYLKLVADLLSLGYTINPYDPGMANKMINRQQITICWHVDDLFMGHQDPTVVTDLLQWLSNQYITPDKKLNVTCGYRHDYLGMNIDFSSMGLVKISMIPYIGKILAATPKKITGVSSSLAADHLFLIRPPPSKLDFCRRNKPMHSTTPRPNFSFSQGFVKTSK
jgi:hypothetical protein